MGVRMAKPTKETDTHQKLTRRVVPARSTLDGFVATVARSDGITLAELDALTTLLVGTLNSLYHVIVLEPPHPRILIRGGQFFPQLTEAQLAGASFGGNMLKLSWLGCGLHMEVCVGGQHIVTSPIQSIEVQPDDSLPGPF